MDDQNTFEEKSLAEKGLELEATAGALVPPETSKSSTDEPNDDEGKESERKKDDKHRDKRKGEKNVDLGRRGEDAATRFLRRRGYEIVERNWKCPAGEADIIARDGDAVVFVEVKTRTSIEKGLPSDAVDQRKRERYEKIAALFLRGFEAVDVPVRFDVVSLLVIGDDRALIRHHINAFATE